MTAGYGHQGYVGLRKISNVQASALLRRLLIGEASRSEGGEPLRFLFPLSAPRRTTTWRKRCEAQTSTG